MRPATHAPHMSLAILITSNTPHRAAARHNAHATAATNAPNKTMLRFPHHAARVHALKPAPMRLTHRSTTSHMLEQHVTSILHHAQATRRTEKPPQDTPSPTTRQ